MVVPGLTVICWPGWYVVPVPVLFVFHPSNVYPLLVGVVAGMVNEYVDEVEVPFMLEGAPLPLFALNDSVKLFVGSTTVMVWVSYAPEPSAAVALTVTEPAETPVMTMRPPVVVSDSV